MHRRRLPWIFMVMVLLTAAGCSGQSSELTTAEMLEKLEGRPMTQAEIEDRLALAGLLCGFENRVLVRVWDQLDPAQLEFQDWVFGHHCPDRLTAYADARPNTGTAPLSPTTTRPPATTGGSGDDGTEVPAIAPEVLEGIERTPATYPEIPLD